MAKEVAILQGGWSAEREVSLMSGAAVREALQSRGWTCRMIDVTRDLRALLAALDPAPDVIFNVLHGRGGEDGTVQGVLDMLGVPYTHSGLRASAIAMAKPVAKRLLVTAGIRSAAGVEVAPETLAAGHPMAPPYVVKPAEEGSSVGVRIVRPNDNAPPIDLGTWHYGEVMVEAYVPGRELTVGVMGDRALTVTEIVHSHGFFDYEAKYTAGHATHVLPAEVPKPIFDLACEWALLAHRTIGARGISRSDFRWDDSLPGTEGLFFLEINTQPGFTPISLVPEQAQHVGVSFPALCEWLIEEATCPG